MSLPKDNSAWIPDAWVPAYLAYAENEAWWTGDTASLAELYGGGAGGRHAAVRKAHRGGRISPAVSSFKGRRRRFFWGNSGTAVSPGSATPRRAHLPAAANLATLSSDLQFAASPKFLLPGEDIDEPTAYGDMIRSIMGSDRSLAQLNIYGEMKAALGSAICVPMWDEEVAPGEVWWEAFGADTAIPEFRSGRLSAVTLWSEAVEGQAYYRLLSRHAVDNGIGFIEHALYKGKDDNIGRRIPLAEHPLGEPYVGLVDEDSRVLTGLTRLDATLGINAPTIEWRRDPTLRYSGRSDFAQLHGLFDDLDRVWNSLLRDIRLGQGRTFLPSAYLRSLGRGQGAEFDELAEYVTRLEIPGDSSGGLPIHHQQHQIRVDEHARALDLTYREILRKAGYSPSAWGEHGEGSGQKTATEIEDRNAASERTRSKKNLHDRQTLGELARICAEIYAAKYGGGVEVIDEIPLVEFPPMSQEQPRELAETVQLLDAAGAISLLEKVTRANPGWTPAQVLTEVEAIRADQGLGVPDPLAIGQVMNSIADVDPDENE